MLYLIFLITIILNSHNNYACQTQITRPQTSIDTQTQYHDHTYHNTVYFHGPHNPPPTRLFFNNLVTQSEPLSLYITHFSNRLSVQARGDFQSQLNSTNQNLFNIAQCNQTQVLNALDNCIITSIQFTPNDINLINQKINGYLTTLTNDIKTIIFDHETGNLKQNLTREEKNELATVYAKFLIAANAISAPQIVYQLSSTFPELKNAYHEVISHGINEQWRPRHTGPSNRLSKNNLQTLNHKIEGSKSNRVLKTIGQLMQQGKFYQALQCGNLHKIFDKYPQVKKDIESYLKHAHEVLKKAYHIQQITPEIEIHLNQLSNMLNRPLEQAYYLCSQLDKDIAVKEAFFNENGILKTSAQQLKEYCPEFSPQILDHEYTRELKAANTILAHQCHNRSQSTKISTSTALEYIQHALNDPTNRNSYTQLAENICHSLTNSYQKDVLKLNDLAIDYQSTKYRAQEEALLDVGAFLAQEINKSQNVVSPKNSHDFAKFVDRVNNLKESIANDVGHQLFAKEFERFIEDISNYAHVPEQVKIHTNYVYSTQNQPITQEVPAPIAANLQQSEPVLTSPDLHGNNPRGSYVPEHCIQKTRELLADFKRSITEIYPEKYYLTNAGRKFLRDNHIDPERFESRVGNKFQHAIHKEHVEQINRLGAVSANTHDQSSFKKLTQDTSFPLIRAAQHQTTHGNLPISIAYTDTSWAFVKLIEATDLTSNSYQEIYQTLASDISTLNQYIHSFIDKIPVPTDNARAFAIGTLKGILKSGADIAGGTATLAIRAATGIPQLAWATPGLINKGLVATKNSEFIQNPQQALCNTYKQVNEHLLDNLESLLGVTREAMWARTHLAQDIDKFRPEKFEASRPYLEQHYPELVKMYDSKAEFRQTLDETLNSSLPTNKLWQAKGETFGEILTYVGEPLYRVGRKLTTNIATRVVQSKAIKSLTRHSNSFYHWIQDKKTNAITTLGFPVPVNLGTDLIPPVENTISREVQHMPLVHMQDAQQPVSKLTKPVLHDEKGLSCVVPKHIPQLHNKIPENLALHPEIIKLKEIYDEASVADALIGWKVKDINKLTEIGIENIETYTTRAYAVNHYHENYISAKLDPAHSYTITRSSIDEAFIALQAKEQGLLTGEISRYAHPSGDILEVKENIFKIWDVKSGISYDIDKNHIFKPSSLVDKIKIATASGENIIINVTDLTLLDYNQLIKIIKDENNINIIAQCIIVDGKNPTRSMSNEQLASFLLK